MALDTENSLLTLSDLKAYLAPGSTSTGNDSRFTDIINAVSHIFNTETGRLLKSRAYSTSTASVEGPEYHDGDGGNVLHTRQFPIVGTPSIRIDSDRAYSTATAVDSTDIIVYRNEGKIVLDDDSFDSGEQSVRLSYTAGYTVSSSSTSSTAGTLPADLNYAAKQMARCLWNQETRNRVGVRNESAEGASISYESDMPWSVKKVLDKYKDWRLG